METTELTGMANSSPISGSGLLELAAGLMLVIAMILLMAWLYRRVGQGALGLGSVIRIVSAVSLGNRDRIALVEIGDKFILLGISPGRINSLHVFEEEFKDSLAQETTISAAGHSATSTDFALKLQKILAGGNS